MCFRSLEAKLSVLRTNFMPLGEDAAQIKDSIAEQERTVADLETKLLGLQTLREAVSSSLAVKPTLLALVPELASGGPLPNMVTLREPMIADLDSEILLLHELKEVAARSLAINRGLLAPIRRLPPEILSEIFDHCLPVKCSRCDESEIFEHRFRVGSSRVKRTDRDAPFLLLRVCRRWHDVAQQTARLWTNIPICCKDSIPYASQCLQNSRSLPLDFCISSIERGDLCRSIWGNPGTNQDRKVVFAEVLKDDSFHQLLVRKIPFARRLEFDGSFDVLSILFPPGNPIKMEALEELIVESTSIPGEYKVSFLKAARLHTLALYDAIHLLSSIEPTNSLRQLTLSAITEVHTGPLYDFLRSCTGIEELIFHCNTDHSRTMEIEDPIHLGALRKLELDSDTASQLLGLLRAPNLQSAVLCYDPTDWQPLRKFFSVARAKLSRLALSTFHLSCPLLHDLMSTLSELETLALENCSADGGLWAYLTPEEGRTPDHWRCPKLRQLDVCRTALGAEFVELIRRRANISSANSEKNSGVDIKLRQCNISLSVAKTLRDLDSELGPFITGFSAEETDDSDSGESLDSDVKASDKFSDHWDN